ncbi:MAG: four-helix bundle copper-binding protein [Chitinophagaceae bacterium]
MIKEMNQELINALNHCAAVCNFCANACLNENNVNEMTTCIRLDLDCAAICNLLASFIARQSPHASHLFSECVEICEKCAMECEKHSHMEHCQVCAEACRHCAEMCSEQPVF